MCWSASCYLNQRDLAHKKSLSAWCRCRRDGPRWLQEMLARSKVANCKSVPLHWASLAGAVAHFRCGRHGKWFHCRSFGPRCCSFKLLKVFTAFYQHIRETYREPQKGVFRFQLQLLLPRPGGNILSSVNRSLVHCPIDTPLTAMESLDSIKPPDNPFCSVFSSTSSREEETTANSRVRSCWKRCPKDHDGRIKRVLSVGLRETPFVFLVIPGWNSKRN
jgi:hypothetical protein